MISRKITIISFSIIAVFLSLLMLQIILAGLFDNIKPADLAIVLGNKVNEDGTPSFTLRSRLNTTIQKYNQGLFSYIMVSGGTGIEGYDEAEFMKQYLVSIGKIPEKNIIVDSEGYNTLKSAQNLLKIMKKSDFQSIFIITSYYHIYRTEMIFSTQGIDYSGSAKGKPVFQFRDLYSVPRELLAIIVYCLRGDARLHITL